jgi:uncharacterized protein YbcI
MAADTSNDTLHGGQLNAAISNSVVRAFAEYIGRGPTKARTSIRDDVVFCMLENNLTKAECSLVAGGREQIVLETRRAHQSTMRAQLVSEVERLTRRKVIAFMSDNHIDPDIATETFVLEPLELEPAEADTLGGPGRSSSTNGSHD